MKATAQHKHQPTRIGLDLPDGVTYVESHMGEFKIGKHPDKDAMVEACQTANSPFVIVDLPYADFVTGPGTGFTVRLKEILSERGYTVTALLCHVPQWGVPIDQRRLMLVACDHVLPHPGVRPVTTVQDCDQKALYHSVVGLPLAKTKPGLFPAMQGVKESRKAPYADTFAYLSYKPLVARSNPAGSYQLVAVTPAEWSDLYGVELCTDFAVLAAHTPTEALNQFIDWAVHADAWEQLQPQEAEEATESAQSDAASAGEVGAEVGQEVPA